MVSQSSARFQGLSSVPWAICVRGNDYLQKFLGTLLHCVHLPLLVNWSRPACLLCDVAVWITRHTCSQMMTLAWTITCWVNAHIYTGSYNDACKIKWVLVHKVACTNERSNTRNCNFSENFAYGWYGWTGFAVSDTCTSRFECWTAVDFWFPCDRYLYVFPLTTVECIYPSNDKCLITLLTINQRPQKAAENLHVSTILPCFLQCVSLL